MVFTRGFADILRIRDERRYDMYDPQIEFPEPLIGPEHSFVVDERIYADGSVGKRPEARDIERLVQQLRDHGVDSVGICFLHSYRNAENEQHVAREIHRRLPAMRISQSSEIAPQIREYLRASTTAVNAYTMPITEPYLERLERRLQDEGFERSALIMLSSGGVVGPATAGRMPVRMIESGPAAGALGAAFAAQALGLDNLLAFDMGGTTAKICLVRDFRPIVTGQFEIDRRYRFKEGSGLPVSVPCVDMIEIGAGGGSIAQVNELGLLRVGPRSAGSAPGPACYGHGGEEPTVTDADVLLGAIDAQNFLGGAMRLDTEAAERAIGKARAAARPHAARDRARHLPAGLRDDGVRREGACGRARRELSRRAAARLRRRGARPCLRGRGAPQERQRHFPAARERLLGFRLAGHAGASRSRPQRALAARPDRLDARGEPVRRDGADARRRRSSTPDAGATISSFSYAADLRYLRPALRPDGRPRRIARARATAPQ